MNATIGLYLIIAMVLGNLLFTEKPISPTEALDRQIQPIADIDSPWTIDINWWRSLDRQQMGLAQYQYLPYLSLAVGPRHLLVPYQTGLIKGFEIAQGDWEWTLKLPFKLSAGIVINDQYAYVAGENGEILKFDAFNGEQINQWDARRYHH